MKGKKIVITLLIVNTLFIGFILYLYKNLDKTAPVITIQDSNLVYTKDLTENQLILGVTAIDDTDGDVSDTLVIEKITINNTKNQALIMYGARDKYGNVVKKSRLLSCLPVNYNQSMKQVADKEKIEKNLLLEQETQQENKESIKNRGENGVKTDNSSNDTITTEQPIVTPKSGDIQMRPVLSFSTQEVFTKKGQNPAWVEVITKLSDDKDSYEDLLSRITIIGKYDNKVMGEYPVIVSVKDSDGNESEKRNITIKVGE